MFVILKGCKFVQSLNCKTLSTQAVGAVCLCVIKVIIIRQRHPLYTNDSSIEKYAAQNKTFKKEEKPDVKIV